MESCDNKHLNKSKKEDNYSSSSDSEFIPINDESESFDNNEYRKFLYTLYPSKYLKNKIEKNENITSSDDDDISIIYDDSEDSEDIEESEYESTSDEETNDSSYDDEKETQYDSESEKEDNNLNYYSSTEEDDDNEYMKDLTKIKNKFNKNGNFNIVLDIDDKFIKQLQEKSNKKLREKNKSKLNKKDNDKKKNNSNKKDDSNLLSNIITDLKKKKKAPSFIYKKLEKYIDIENKKYENKLKEVEKKKKNDNMKQFKKLLKNENINNDIKYFDNLKIYEQKKILKDLELINKESLINKPYTIQILETNIPNYYKNIALRKINSLKSMDPYSGEYYKVKEWVDGFMKIPFGKYETLPININDGLVKTNRFLNKSKKILDDCVYGLDDAKLQIMQVLGQLISNPNSIGTAIALKGPMGTGKTTLVKEGISKILKRPFAFIALGGATDSSFLEGHSYTYEGSIWGKIVDILMKSRCMNPVIYFDELDKISDTPKGEEITNILTHLTDTTQNSQFHDKYFTDVHFDLSKALFIFSYNDESKVNPILKDRMYRIETKGYNCNDKIKICNKYLIPTIRQNISFNNNEIVFTEKVIEYIVNNYTEKEKGVRNLKRCLEIIYSKLNLVRLTKNTNELFENLNNLKFPLTLNEEIINKLIKKSDEENWPSHMYI